MAYGAAKMEGDHETHGAPLPQDEINATKEKLGLPNEYFYLPHRKEARGIGGIFFDYKMDNWEKDFLFTKDVGITFAHLVTKIIRKKMFSKWTKKEKKIQQYKRGRYVEFNLLYDRGTKFGLNSGGNPEAILMSMPPNAKWK